MESDAVGEVLERVDVRVLVREFEWEPVGDTVGVGVRNSRWNGVTYGPGELLFARRMIACVSGKPGGV